MDKRKKSAQKNRRGAYGASTGRRRNLTPHQSKRRRKLRIWLLYSFMIVVVAGTGIALSLTVLFKIDTIEVVGKTRYAAEDIIKTSQIVPGQNLFLCKAKAGSDSVEQELPYIENAKIARRIPGKIVITVTEAAPAGIIQFSDKYFVVSGSGKVLESADQPVADLPIIKGLELSKAQLADVIEYKDQNAKQILQDITTAIQNNSLPKIKEIDLTKLASPKLNYDNRITIYLGLPSDLDFKIRGIMQMLQDATIEGNKGVIDASIAVDSMELHFIPYSSLHTAAGTAAQSADANSSSPANAGVTESSGRPAG